MQKYLMKMETSKITINAHGLTASVEYPSDSTLSEVGEHLKVLLVAVGYNYESVCQLINNEE